MHRWLLATGGILGALGVIAGALGAHLFQARLSELAYASYTTAVNYLFLHAVALLGLAAWWRAGRGTRIFSVSVAGLVIGTVLFAGGLFGWTLQGWAWARRCAPWGGSLLMFAWLGVAVSALRAEIQTDNRTGR